MMKPERQLWLSNLFAVSVLALRAAALCFAAASVTLTCAHMLRTARALRQDFQEREPA